VCFFPSFFAVRECCRRQGYGEALLRAAIVKCRERPISRLTLHVDPMRDAAMNLYKKLGFELDTVVIDYYAPHRDAHRMFIDFGTP
jgi:ribosomal protein S18 acetylase RimI-like enzyme